MSSPFIKTAELPITFNCPIPKPSPDPLNDNCILITTRYDENKTESGIYSYDIETNKSKMIYAYPKTDWSQYKVYWHSQFVNPFNNTLVLYGGQYNTYSIFDIKTNELEQYSDKNLLKHCGNHPQNALIPSPINEMHIIGHNCNHIMYDITNKNAIKIDSQLQPDDSDDDSDDDDDILHPKLVYLDKLFVFGANNMKKIFEYENGKWKVNKSLEMPFEENQCYYDIISCFGMFLVVIYFREKKIFIFDKFDMKWYESKYNIKYNFEGNGYFCHALKVNLEAHIIDFYHNVHFKFKLLDLILENSKIFPRIYDALIVGYLRRLENEADLEMERINVSSDVKAVNLVLKYAGSFL